jgi:hypothetical protein
MQAKKYIILRDATGFLEPLLKQTYQDYIIEQEFNLEKINENSILIANEDSIPNELSYLCPTIFLTSEVNIDKYNPQIRTLITPCRYNDLINLINSSKPCATQILSNTWINIKTLVTINSGCVAIKDLTSIEIKLLQYLALNDASFKSKNYILRNVFAYKDNIDTNTLETNIYRLRKKLEPELSIVRDKDQGYQLKNRLS